MILNRQLKLIVLFNAKTGSKSLRQVLLNAGFEIPADGFHHNSPLCRLPVLFPDFDVDNELMQYRVATFYRDPVDRQLSNMAWFLENHGATYGVDPNIGVIEFMETVGMAPPQVLYLENRTNMFDATPWHPVPIELYNFHDFDNEVVRLAASFGYNINPNTVPKLNESRNRKQIEDLTPEESNYIKDTYQMDYAFFASKGITVPTS